MSGFPGCTDEDMRTLARWLRQRHWNPQQTQCFIPTPGTIATAMFYCGQNEAGEPIYVARTDAQRLRQHHILMPTVEGGDNPQRKTRNAQPYREARKPETNPSSARDARRSSEPGQERNPAERQGLKRPFRQGFGNPSRQRGGRS